MSNPNQCVDLNICSLTAPIVSETTFETFWQVGTRAGQGPFDLSSIPQAQVGTSLLVTDWVGVWPEITDLGVAINGGIPQLGNWAISEADFINYASIWCPDPNFDGWIVLDFEKWLPAWELLPDEGVGVPSRYKTASRTYAQSYISTNFPSLNMTAAEIENYAVLSFEKAGAIWFNKAIALVRQLRPNVKIGFYNLMAHSYFEPLINDEGAALRRGDDKLVKVIKNCDAVMPSPYAIFPSYGPCAPLPANCYYAGSGQYVPPPVGAQPGEAWLQNNLLYTYGMINEAKRLAKLAGGIKVIPYSWGRYHPNAGLSPWAFDLNRVCDFENQTLYIKHLGCDGVIIWGDETAALQVSHGSFQTFIDTVIAPTLTKIYS